MADARNLKSRRRRSQMSLSHPPRLVIEALPRIRGGKKERTRQRLVSVALALFAKKGFEETTLQEIAEAADVSLRTYFHHFSSKEDVVGAWQDAARSSILQHIRTASPRGGVLQVAQEAVIAAIADGGHEAGRATALVVQQSPTLRARDRLKNEELELAMAEELHLLFGRAVSSEEVAMAAMIALGAGITGTRLWAAEGGKTDPVLFGRRMFKLINEQLIQAGSMEAPPRARKKRR